MSIRKPMFALVAALGLGLGGCMQATLEPASETSMKPRDKELLANAPYAKASIPEQYQRHIVAYHRGEAPGTIVIDSDARYLYYVLPGGRALRYGVTGGASRGGRGAPPQRSVERKNAQAGPRPRKSTPACPVPRTS